MRSAVESVSVTLALLAVFGNGCSSSSTTKAKPCTPGETASCSGPNGCQGKKTCNDTGSAFGACQCAAGSGGSAGLSGSGGIGGTGATGGVPDASSGATGGASNGGTSGGDAAAEQSPPACDISAPFGPPTLVSGGVNSPDDDFSPRLSSDELTIYFARRPLDDVTAPTDLYVATRSAPTSVFDAAVPLGLSTASNDGDPMIATDSMTLFFSSDRPNGVGEFDLYWASRSNAGVPFTSATLVPTVNSLGSELQPFLTSDGELWFAYRRAGFNSAVHLRRAPRAGLGFAAPVAVTELDSLTDDMWPVLTGDKLTIYFSSLRTDSGAQGKADVWVAQRSSASGTFGPASDVSDVNSPATDLVGWISPDACRLYLASNRGTSAGYEIYVATR